VYAALVEPFTHPDGLFHASASVLPLLLYGDKGFAFVTDPKAWEKPQVSLEFANALPKLGPRAGPIVAHYQKQLGSASADDVKGACSKLGASGRAAAPAAARLAELVRTGPPDVRSAAARALGQVAADGTVAVPTLKTLLKTGDKQDAVIALSALGPVARADVISALKPLFTNPEDEVVQRAAAELVRCAPEVVELYPALVRRARFSPVPLDYVSKEALPGLRPLLTAEDKRDREVAALVVVRLDPADATARRIVLGLDWLDPDEFSRPPVKRVNPGIVAALPGLGADAVPPLERLLGDADANVRASAAHAIGRVGPSAKSAIPALRKALGASSAGEQLAAAEALALIDPADRSAVPVLLELARPANREKLEAIKLPGAKGEPADRLATSLWRIDPETAVKSGALAAGNVLR
jgi:HEAT repeat protein